MTDPDASEPGPPGGEAVPAPPGPESPPEVLPPVLAPMREPKSFSVHWGVDAAVCFLALVIVLWIFLGVPILVVVAVSLLVGLAAAPVTRNLERTGLTDRARRHRESGPGTVGPADPTRPT